MKLKKYELKFKQHDNRAFRFVDGFDAWIYCRNKVEKEVFTKEVRRIKVFPIYELNFYRYKRFLVQYIAAHQKNAPIPTAAKELMQIFYNKFEKPFQREFI